MSRSPPGFYKLVSGLLDTKLNNRLPDLVITAEKEPVECSIKRDNYSDFYSIYCKASAQALETDTPLQIVQLPKETMPFVIRFNLKFLEFANDRNQLLSDIGIAGITQAIQSYLANNFVFDNINNFDACIVLTSDLIHLVSNSLEYSTFSIMFQFPMCRVDRSKLQNKYSVELVDQLQKVWPGGNGIFEVLPSTKTWDKMIDMRIYKQGLPYYGSVYRQTDAFLKFLCAYNSLDKVTQNYDYTQELLDDTSFDPTQHTKVEQRKIREKEFFLEDFDIKPWYYLPLILSVDYWGCLTNEIEKGKRDREERQRKDKVYDIQELIKTHVNVHVEKRKSMDRLYSFISLWDVKRVLDRRFCLDLGRAFFDITKGEPAGLLNWMAVMKSAIKNPKNTQHYYTDKNIRKKCDEAYNTFACHGVTIDTVEWYASIDNPEKYDEIQDAWCSKTKTGILSCLEGDVAQDFRREFPLKYVCAHDGNKPRFYIYSNHRYKIDYGGLSIKKCMGTHYLLKIQKMKNDISKQLEVEGYSKEVGDVILNKLNKLGGLLRTQAFKNKLLFALAEEYKSRYFETQLDQNPEVLGTPNGVIAATDSDILFRDGKPEDYITRSCKVTYRKDYSWDHQVVEKAMRWARETFVDTETIDYFWKFMASLLRGRNNDKKLMIWSGKSGNNSKSMWVRALSCVLGTYFTKIPMNLFTQGRGKANDHSAVEAAADGCRVLVAEEPEDSVPLLSSIIKAETGDDDKIVREMYKGPRPQIPMHKTIIVCNAVPVMTAEEAMEERVVVHPFESKWKNNAPKLIKEQFASRTFKVNPFFNKEIPSIAPGIMWIMYNYYPKYIEEGINKKPALVEAITKKYWDANDRYLKFIAENIETGDSVDRIEATDMFMRFSRWHYISYRKLDVPDKYKSLEELEKKQQLGPMIDGGWSGVRLKDKN